MMHEPEHPAPVVDGYGDAVDEWTIVPLPGGYVCSACGMPVESEPCRDHQPHAWGRIESGVQEALWE